MTLVKQTPLEVVPRITARLAILATLASCSAVGEINERAVLAQSEAGMPEPATAAYSPPTRTEYRLGPRDLIEIEVYELEEPNTTKVLRTRVSEDGEIVLPLIGAVPAASRTTRELQREIETRLRADFLVHPSVNVLVVEFRARSVTVLGAVDAPGTYHLEANSTTLVDALAIAGGATEEAGNQIVVMRSPPDSVQAANASFGAPAQPSVLHVDLAALVERGDFSSNCVLQDGDVVHVPSVPLFYVTGHVYEAGAFPLRGEITVLRAVALAGGLRDEASPGSTVLIRRRGERRITIDIDLAELEAGSDRDLRLEADDVLVVGQSATDKVLHNIGALFRGLFHFGYGLN